MQYEQILEYSPYSLTAKEKDELLTSRLKTLTRIHYDKCEQYRLLVDGLEYDVEHLDTYYDLPFLPVRLFKQFELKSIQNENVFKIMTSSGTTGQSVSKIILDRNTASNQQKTLVKIVSDYTGNTRMPMLIIDSPSVLKNRAMFSARGAGILGFSIFASQRQYALDEDMQLDIEGITSFLEKHKGKTIFIFGFTFMVWEYFYKELVRRNIRLDLSDSVLIHGGGWKKLQHESVNEQEYKYNLNEVCKISRVHDYYGMVEQTGCIYMECEYGHLHASIYSDIITRRKDDFSPCEFGEVGIIQVVSTIPESYPGHSILTEDEGIILGQDDCPCKRKGKYFKVVGRIKNAEIRGCSDTYEKSTK